MLAARLLGWVHRACSRGEDSPHRADDTPATLRDRLNDLYLDEVRKLRARQRAGEIPLAEYARHARALQERYLLLGLPLELWTEP